MTRAAHEVAHERTDLRRPVAGRGRAWLGLWGGGVVWLLHFLTLWALAEFGCQGALASAGPLGVSWVAWLVLGATVVAAALGASSTALAWRAERRARERDRSASREGQAAAEAVAFAARVGWVAGGVFTLVILVEAAPVLFFLRGCGEGAP